MFNKSFNVVIATLSLNNRFCILKKTVILFGYSSTLHHPVTATIKRQFLRGKLLIISCILRVQYLCRRLMHLYFTPWPKKRSKTVKLYWWRSISEMHVIIFWDLLSKVSILLKCDFFVHPSCIWALLQSAHLSLLWFSSLLALLDDTTWTSTATKTFITLIN